MKKLFMLFAILRVCWGPLETQCGEYMGQVTDSAPGKPTVYYIVKLNSGAIAMVETDLIIEVNRSKKP